jgi:hypothetical protein
LNLLVVFVERPQEFWVQIIGNAERVKLSRTVSVFYEHVKRLSRLLSLSFIGVLEDCTLTQMGK